MAVKRCSQKVEERKTEANNTRKVQNIKGPKPELLFF